MRRVLLATGLLMPSICLASGDPAIVWALGGAALTWLFVAALLVMWLSRSKVRLARLIAFLLVGILAWYWFLNARGDQLMLQTLALVGLALVFLIRRPRT